jgi:hypothetical protein
MGCSNPGLEIGSEVFLLAEEDEVFLNSIYWQGFTEL